MLTELKNVGQLKLLADSLSGDIKRRHKNEKGYLAYVNISTMSGDIIVIYFTEILKYFFNLCYL